ncbi:MAG: carbon storage regulator [Tatlockia sp.]|jgi:carbon storage regulator
MDIVTIPFEEPLTICINSERVQVIAFKTLEHGNIKFGVEAPRSVAVHREEIYHAIKQKLLAEQID